MQSHLLGAGSQHAHLSHRSQSCSSQSSAPMAFTTSLHGRRVALSQSPRRSAPTHRNLSLQVTDAITRQRKEETVAYLTETMDKSIVMFGVRYKKISDKAMTEFRRALPDDAKMIVAKNTLMRKAAEQRPDWKEIGSATTLENAWVFSGEEGVSQTVKAFLEFEKKLLSTLPQEKRKTTKLTDVSGGVLQGEPIDYDAVKALKDLPTRAELMQKIGRLIRKVPTKLAISIKLVPTKLAVAVKQLGDGDDNKDLKVGDVFPKPEAAGGDAPVPATE